MTQHADPHHRTDSKTAALAAAEARPNPGSRIIPSFSFGRDILRSGQFIQAGRGAERMPRNNPENLPVFFLDGEIHKKRRSQIAGFFTPKAMKERYRATMERSTAKLIDELRQTGRQRLDAMSFELACDVAAEIIGLTASDPRGLARRVRAAFTSKNRLAGLVNGVTFYLRDVLPAIRARRKQRQSDVISLVLDLGYSNWSILMECITYGSAGMTTTREFIVVAAWHLFEREDLREKFLNGGEAMQFAILDEILRIDPVVTHIHRRATEDFVGSNGEQVKAGELCAIELRSANLDEAVAGANPHVIDPERGKRERMAGSWMSFGDGAHRCPGAQVAMHETRVFLDALLRVPGVRLANPPEAHWTGTTYELHGAFVECDVA